MSNLDLREESVPHRGFTIKAREVLLEPPAPFALTKETSGSCCSLVEDNTKAPHRGFTAKAREMLVERQAQDNHHGLKFPLEVVRSELDLFHRSQTNASPPIRDGLPVHRATTAYDEKRIEIPHSKLSRIKAHKLLGDIGKTRSANDIFYDKYKKRLRSPSPISSLTSSRSVADEDKAVAEASFEAVQLDVSDEVKKPDREIL